MSKSPPRITAKRERYCDIRATSLQEILSTCDRHIKNIGLTQLDAIENQDETDSDRFYCDMFRRSWQDLRDDVAAILAKEAEEAKNGPAPKPLTGPEPLRPSVHVVEMTEHERGWGQRPDGNFAFYTEKEARDYMDAETKGRSIRNVPDEYVTYQYIGLHQCSDAFYKKIGESENRRVYFDKMRDLDK